jgi:hypothetical protein
MKMKEIFERIENDRINCGRKNYPKSYNLSNSEAKFFIIKDSYNKEIDLKIEWEKIIHECKMPSEKANDEKEKGSDDVMVDMKHEIQNEKDFEENMEHFNKKTEMIKPEEGEF